MLVILSYTFHFYMYFHWKWIIFIQIKIKKNMILCDYLSIQALNNEQIAVDITSVDYKKFQLVSFIAVICRRTPLVAML